MRFNRLFLYLLLSTFLTDFSLASVEINEIMYNPGQCDDNYCEWIELYNPNDFSINISNCSLDGKALQGELNDHSYLLIVRNLANFTYYFGSQNSVIEQSISLKNSGEEIVLEGNENCSDSFDYTDYVDLADGNNKTLEKNKDGQWQESLVDGGTPGQQNSNYEFSYDYSILKINEFLPDPIGEDDGNKPLGEWVELYNPGSQNIDLKGLILKDSKENGKLPIADNKIIDESGTIICAGCYKTIYRDGDTDFSLNSDYDEVRLFKETTLIDSVSYSGSTEGMSISKIGNQWYHTIPTPNKENYYVENCDWKINLLIDNSIFKNKDLSFTVEIERLYGFAQNISVKGTIEDIFGGVIKEYSPWKNETVIESYKKISSYSPNLAEGIYMVKFEIFSLNCNERNLADNKVTKLIAINPQYKENSSSLNIGTLYLGNDEEAEWGDQFRAKINIYKGQETKYSIQLWAEKDKEKISKTTKLNIYEEYQLYNITLPIQLIPNCNQKIEDGQAILVLEGLGLRTEQPFTIGGVDKEICKDYLDYIEEIEEEKKSKIEHYQIIDLPSSIKIGDVLKVKVQLLGDDSKHDYKLWSYLYKGSRCYSCYNKTVENDYNLQELTLNENELKSVEFLIKVDDGIEEGEYKLKVKINKDRQKTDKELTEKIYILSSGKIKEEVNFSSQQSFLESNFFAESSLEANPESNLQLKAEKEKIIDVLNGIIVYESSSEKAKRLIPYFLAITFGLFCIVLIGKNNC
ncbi:MAG: lamin tail domain-containing protein [Nanoarchaeota archaeon]|nr:lamin tail domain-containing protein [Nanoarchaeota archaeon]MBU1632449.1 lamin tail domain-containing protein [Nanoarchaeota archaeon]MBU1876333.1 lamin tail domain-containing protein [Nanoarchaeota archaeon]